MRGFSHYTKDSYYRKAKEILEYFGKPMNQVTTKELREFLMKHIREEKKISERSCNYYGNGDGWKRGRLQFPQKI